MDEQATAWDVPDLDDDGCAGCGARSDDGALCADCTGERWAFTPASPIERLAEVRF